MMRSPLTILVGPTCGGKSTLLKSMVEDLGYTPFISHTNSHQSDHADIDRHGKAKWMVEITIFYHEETTCIFVND